MLLDAALSYAHFVSAFLLAGTLCAEAFVIRLPITSDVIRLLSRIDLFYGLSAVLVIAAGVCRIYFGLKPEAYYLASHAFWGKMALFAIIGIVSIAPTMKFLAWNKKSRKDAAFAPAPGEVKTVRRLLLIEVHVFALIPILAALMARGTG